MIDLLFCESLGALAKQLIAEHQSDIFVLNLKFKFFDKIISLGEAKLNAIIMVSKSYWIVNDPNKNIYENFNDKFIEYQTNFNRTKTLAKFKMKITLYTRFMKDFQFK